MLLLFLILILGASFSNANDLADGCALRCIAKCVLFDKNAIQSCIVQCQVYNSSDLCKPQDKICWSQCRDLIPIPGIGSHLFPVNAIDSFGYSSGGVNFGWNATDGNVIYVLRFTESPTGTIIDSVVVDQPKLLNYQTRGDPCKAQFVRIVPVSPNVVGNFSTPALRIAPPQLKVSSHLSFVSAEYQKQSLPDVEYNTNGSVVITLSHEPIDWPLGNADLTLFTVFHQVNCEIPDLSHAVPVPEFTPVPGTNQLRGVVGADLMRRGCGFAYFLSSVSSRRCGIRSDLPTPSDQFQYLKLDCNNVTNSPCRSPPRSQPPVCGQVENFRYSILNENSIAGPDKNLNISVNVSFDPIFSFSYKPLYFVALYGLANDFEQSLEAQAFGVNITEQLGMAASCTVFDSNGFCADLFPTDSIVVPDLHMDILYGVTICAVVDPRNLEFPKLDNSNRRMVKPKADRIFISSQKFIRNHTAMILGITLGAVAFVVLISVIIVARCCYTKTKEMKEMDVKLEQLRRETEERYTRLPRRNDIWELERRNLIIYDDKKLGAGAFGAVYLGKIIGTAKAHKDSQSTLGVNLMRAENCNVAVKMLPEYADEASKSDFRQEINLMKSLGYHERLVNMLACVTGSEPLCLVVEFCSDGDMLHFLRARCKYMLKLEELGIDYHNGDNSVDYDTEMIATLKQLLMFAVQISYGLEYLSSKGFLHRDVAARNVLVHDRSSAKIGDFGLCRYIYNGESANYKSKGGRLPIKWMSPEAIRFYEFSTKSDVWSFGILMFEIITLGGSPYPGVQPEEMLPFLERGNRMEQPDNCPDQFYSVMKSCWEADPQARPEFSSIRQRLATQLEQITEDYSYLKLDARRDYYNFNYTTGTTEEGIVEIPGDDEIDRHNKINAAEQLPLDILALEKLNRPSPTWSTSPSVSLNSVSSSSIDDLPTRCPLTQTISGDSGRCLITPKTSSSIGDLPTRCPLTQTISGDSGQYLITPKTSFQSAEPMILTSEFIYPPLETKDKSVVS